MEFEVKVWKQLLLTWHKKKLIIRDNDFQIEKYHKDPKKKDTKTYSLYDAVLVDQSKHTDLQILVGTASYKIFLKPLSTQDKDKIIAKLEERIKKHASQNTFSQEYLRQNEEILGCFDNSTYGQIVKKLNIFQALILEMAQKLDSFKTMIQNNHVDSTNSMLIHNNLMLIKEEMKKQFDEIVASVYNYHDQLEGLDTSVLTKKNYKYTDNEHRENDVSSEEEVSSNELELEQNINIDDNIKRQQSLDGSKSNSDSEKKNKEKEENKNEEKEENKNEENKEDNKNEENNEDNKNEEKNKDENEKKNETENNNKILQKKESKEKKNPYYFLSNDISDFQNPDFNFEKRTSLPHKINCPKNIVKEMITNLTKRLPSPVYFNEPLSMGQKECEKFLYMDLLKKAGLEESKEMQMCYIAAFIIGEIFLNIGRNLKPFNPIIGETYEYYDNEKNFRFYSEQVSHNPQVNAYIAETPEFAYYGDTLNTNSFKFLKGAIELLFINKIHVHCKKTNSHYIYNPPSVYVKGIMKPPLYSDYAGTTVIQNINDTSYRCELKFIEEGWTPDSLGGFEGTVFKDYENVVYLLRGNWKSEIYMTDPDGNNRVDLLKINDEEEYLKNNIDSYVIPEYSCRLNQLTEELEKSLPKNDSRFRQDMRLLEKDEDTTEAQKFKERYEEKQRKELCNDEHQIQFFTELASPETDGKYYIPNGKYWEYKKEGKLKDNLNKDIFDLEGY